MSGPPASPPPSVPERDPAPAPPAAPRRRRVAWLVALGADALQWIALPLFAPGAVSPFDAGLDVVVTLAMVRLLGWHWAFLPSFVAELVPGVNLVPTWTLAVWLATRGRAEAPPGRGRPPL